MKGISVSQAVQCSGSRGESLPVRSLLIYCARSGSGPHTYLKLPYIQTSLHQLAVALCNFNVRSISERTTKLLMHLQHQSAAALGSTIGLACYCLIDCQTSASPSSRGLRPYLVRVLYPFTMALQVEFPSVLFSRAPFCGQKPVLEAQFPNFQSISGGSLSLADPSGLTARLRWISGSSLQFIHTNHLFSSTLQSA